MRTLCTAALTVLLVATALGAQQAPYRTLDDKFTPPTFTDAGQWNTRAAYLREHVLASAGLLPMPARAPLAAQVFGEIKRNDYIVAKVYFQSLPGFLVTGNLYRPAGDGPFPAVLAPHGHWAYGRLENTTLNSVPGRAINLARQGFVVFTYDMVGYDDSRQLTHTFGGKRETLWGLSLGGLQLWNSIRSLDFLQSLPYVQRDALAVTGESGGGTQTFLLAAVDDRVKVAVPVNMISLHMQGGCLCENPPSLRLDTTNVEIAATIAPRPLLMVSATGDWTANTLEAEYPAVRRIYSLLDAPDRVQAVRIQAEHNYNKESREAMYAWLARWMKGAPADVQVRERSFTADSPADLLVFHQRPLPPEALTAEQVTEHWITEAKKQLTATDRQVRARALRHALGYGDVRPAVPRAGKSSVVLLAGDDAELERELRSARFTVKKIGVHAVRRRRGGEGAPLRNLQPHAGGPTRRGHRFGARRRPRRGHRRQRRRRARGAARVRRGHAPARRARRRSVRHVEGCGLRGQALRPRTAARRQSRNGGGDGRRCAGDSRRRRELRARRRQRGADQAVGEGDRRAPAAESTVGVASGFSRKDA